MPGVGTNRYAYADNDPINRADRNGHQIEGPVDLLNHPEAVERDEFHEMEADLLEMKGQELADQNSPDADIYFEAAERHRMSMGLSNQELLQAAALGVAFQEGLRGIGGVVTKFKVLGKAQQNFFAGRVPTGHAMASLRAAYSLSKKIPALDRIHFNQTLGTITDKLVRSGLRPDVALVHKDGRIDLVEILSGRQTVGQLQEKLTKMMSMLPEARRGSTYVFRKDDPLTRR